MDAWLKLFIALACISMIAQFGVLLATFLEVRKLGEKMGRLAEDMRTRTEPVLSRLNEMLQELQPRLSSVAADTAEIAHIGRLQAERLDRVFADAADRLRAQVIRADHMITGALERIEDTGAEMRRTLLAPLHQASALIKGISAGIEYLRTQRRPPERSREHQDEELFI
jgi:hypothetical protein